LLTITVTTAPEVPGSLRPDAFEHLLHLAIDCPALDAAWTHTLIDYQVALDGNSARLTVHSAPPRGVSLTHGIRLVSWVPAAHVKAHAPDGTELAAVRLNAPLQPGQPIEIGDKAYLVSGEPTWPHRDPETGVCRGDIDWQHVTVTEAVAPLRAPTARQ
jgi:hypothetical protein